MNTFETGKRIRYVRELRGLTREECSEAADITPRFLYDIELGFKSMSLRTLSALCHALDISADYILFGEMHK